jgi:hypothetical protein
MLFATSVGAARVGAPDDVFALEVDREIVLIGRPSTFAGLPRDLFRPDMAMMLLHKLSARPPSTAGLRRYLAGHGDLPHHSDRDLLQRAAEAIRSRHLDAIVVVGGYGRNYVGPPIGSGKPAPPAPTGGKLLLPDDPSVARWSNKERVAEAMRRALARSPAEVAAQLRLLLTADGVDNVVDSVAFEEVTQPRQHGWANDGAVAGIALAFGGVAGLHALRDLADFLKRAAEARTLRDIEAAAEALVRAATALDVPGLLAILHKTGERKAGGSREPAAEYPSFRQLAAAQAARLEARQSRIPPPPPPPKPPPPANRPTHEALFGAPAAQARAYVAGARKRAAFCEICK